MEHIYRTKIITKNVLKSYPNMHANPQEQKFKEFNFYEILNFTLLIPYILI